MSINRSIIIINSGCNSPIAWTKFSIIAKWQPVLWNRDTTTSEKRRHYRLSGCRIKIPPGWFRRPSVSWARRRGLRTVGHCAHRATVAPRPPSIRPVGTTSVLPAQMQSTSPAQRNICNAAAPVSIGYAVDNFPNILGSFGETGGSVQKWVKLLIGGTASDLLHPVTIQRTATEVSRFSPICGFHWIRRLSI